MMMSLTSHFLSNVTLSNSATGRTIEIDASDLVMKVDEQLIQWANDDESDNEENDGNDKNEHL